MNMPTPPAPLPENFFRKEVMRREFYILRMLSIQRVGERGEKLHVIGHSQQRIWIYKQTFDSSERI
jgi:hypothetical protein